MTNEHLDANIALALGPCAEHEFDLVELSERTLAPERATVVQAHVQECARCRAYLAELSALDQTLDAALPRPELTADFDARLAERIALLRRSPDRSQALDAAERDHQQLLHALGGALDWRTVLNAIALGTATGGALLALDAIAPGVLQANGLVPSGYSGTTIYALVLSAAFVIGGIGFARRIAGGSLLRAGA